MYGPKPLIPLKAPVGSKKDPNKPFFFLSEQSGATPPSTRKASMLGRSTESFQAEQKQLYNIPSNPEKAGAGSQKDSPAGNVSKAWCTQEDNLSLLGCLAWSRGRFPIPSPLFLTQQMLLNFPFPAWTPAVHTQICIKSKFKFIEDV